MGFGCNGGLDHSVTIQLGARRNPNGAGRFQFATETISTFKLGF
jgi:hypothetical protein